MSELDLDHAGFPRIDRTAFSVANLHDEPDERAYWWSRTPEERFRAAAMMRRVNYGHERATARRQPVLKIAEREGRY